MVYLLSIVPKPDIKDVTPMDALEQARAEIDEVDAQLAALFERRMAAVLQVAEYKRAHGLPIFDAAREAAVLEKAAARIHAPALRPYYKDHVQNMMDVAKQYEALILGQNRAAYQGVEGAFAHIALRALFPHAEAVSCPTWDEVFAAVERGDAAHGVVPFENSHAGDVSAVLDLCYNHPALWVVDVYDLPISQNLLVLPGTLLAFFAVYGLPGRLPLWFPSLYAYLPAAMRHAAICGIAGVIFAVPYLLLAKLFMPEALSLRRRR